ncbi:MAG: hypothetical protein OEW34_09515 [Burkholderiaceae bacterium]|jgi:uncharacterized membrane protein|nr:hypothetical protein [Burkholderiaceae bacterium]
MSATEPVPSSREFTFVGIAYGLHVTGLFLIWPALVGIVLDYVKRGDVEGTMLESHYTWLIRTFWWSVLWGSAILAGMLTVIVPNALLIADLARAGNYLAIPWSIILAAVLGGIGLSVVWFWVVYRLVRGVLRLSDGRPAP